MTTKKTVTETEYGPDGKVTKTTVTTTETSDPRPTPKPWGVPDYPLWLPPVICGPNGTSIQPCRAVSKPDYVLLNGTDRARLAQVDRNDLPVEITVTADTGAEDRWRFDGCNDNGPVYTRVTGE